MKILWFIVFVFWSTQSLSLSYVMSEKHYVNVVSYQVIDHIEERSLEIKKVVKERTGKPLNTESFWNFFFVQGSEGLKIKRDKESRVRLIYIYLDQWRTLSGKGYSSDFDGVHLTKEDLNKIKVLFSASELHIIKSLISLWNVGYHPIQAFRSSLWDLSKIRESKYQEFEFLWAFLIIESQIVAHFFPGGVDPNSLPEIINRPSPPFRKAQGIIRRLARKGFVPAQHLEGFMNMIFHKDLNTALVWIEQSYQRNYRKDICSVLLGVFYRRLYPHYSAKAEYYLKEAVYTHDYRTHNYRFLKGELLDLYIETGALDKASRIAREIAENFTDFSIPTFLQSMQWLSLYFYNKANGNMHTLRESYTWMEMARLAVEDYGLSRNLSRQKHSISLMLRLPPEQRRKIKLEVAALYQARKQFLTAYPSRSCTPSLFH